MNRYAPKLMQFESDVNRGFGRLSALAMQLEVEAIENARIKGCEDAVMVNKKKLNSAPIEKRKRIAQFLVDCYGSHESAIRAVYQ